MWVSGKQHVQRYARENNAPVMKCICCVEVLILFIFYFFKDTFKLYQIISGAKNQVPFDGKGIAWWTDYNVKYRNPSVTPLRDAFNGST